MTTPVVEFEMYCKWCGTASRGILTTIAIFILTLAASSEGTLQMSETSPFETLSSDDLQMMLHASQPKLRVDTKALSLVVDSSTGRTILSGRCTPGSRVFISAKQKPDSITVPCHDGSYRAAIESNFMQTHLDFQSTQMTNTGEILWARLADNQVAATADREISTLASLPGLRGGHVIIAPGTYYATQLTLDPTEPVATEPLVIDGQGSVILRGVTRLNLNRANVTVRGLVFEGDTDITVNAPNVRITESTFRGCGQIDKPKAQCILVRAPAAEIDSNHFIGSNSMTIKVRADIDDANQQPFDTYIHHNEFRDIDRHSGNGQEPIQVAGPNGGATMINLRTRIENNVFVATNGDVETISAKAPGVHVRWNAFFNMDSAPNLRGADQDEISGNLLVHTRPIRIAGQNHIISGNTILCPKDTGIAISHGSAHYAAARHNTITSNIVMTKKSAISFFTFEPPPLELASDNRIDGNVLITSSRYPAIVAPDVSPSAMNTSFTGTNQIQNAEDICH